MRRCWTGFATPFVTFLLENMISTQLCQISTAIPIPASTARHQFLKGSHHTDLHLECQIDTPGRYIIRGELRATDLDNPFKQPFAFQITVAESGRIYTELTYQPYITGAGLDNDRTFVGRTDLLAWIGSLWRQPDGKPTIVLIGQRRIGKTSLLNKIKRESLERTRLIPV